MEETVLQSIFSAAFLGSILRVTTPILLPSLGALISDRAGVINIGLEGTMLELPPVPYPEWASNCVLII